ASSPQCSHLGAEKRPWIILMISLRICLGLSSMDAPTITGGQTAMKRALSIAILALTVSTSLVAQAPQGWKQRIDRSTSASDPDATGLVKFVSMGTGFHATTPQAAVFWKPADTATGIYTLKGTFLLQKPSGHTNYYGLVFGGAG